MEVTDANLQLLAQHLQETLSPDPTKRRASEKFLESIEGNPNYANLLLNLVDKQNVDIVIRVAGSVTFKNFIKRNWSDEETNKISQQDREAIKTFIVSLMLKSPEKIQRQLSDAVSIIGKEDFPDKWPTLLPELVQFMTQSGDFAIINGVLTTAHSLFKRYRHEFKSQALWTEIKLVLDSFAKPLTELFVNTVQLSKEHAVNPQGVKILYSSLVLIAKIFYSLNAQELPEFFEDNIQTWMTYFLELLSVNNKLLETNDDDEPGLLEQLKSQICDNVAMYSTKYGEEFEKYLPGFVQSIWGLLMTTGVAPKYDLLVSCAIRFITNVAERPGNKSLFETEGVLQNLCEKVIIPNMQFRDSDEELFEDNPEEYIRRDIEGSDVDTRRRAACDLVKILSRHFEAQIVSVFGQFIQTMLANFQNSPDDQWKSKDTAIYLVTSMTVKGSTVRDGTTSTSELVNVVDFYQNFIRSDLAAADLNKFPVLRADALKYIMTFRNQLPLDAVLIPAIQLIVHHLDAPSNVVHTYAAHTLERLLTLRSPPPNPSPLITFAQVQTLAPQMLSGLFGIFKKPNSSENEYAMKAIMRTISFMQENILPYLGDILPQMTQKLTEVSRNPSKPHFNHYLFESMSLAIKIACQKDATLVTSFEGFLFPVFEEILKQDVQEFMPYIFQIMSMLLELHDNVVPETYMAMFPSFLAPVLWERPANYHPLVRLLQAFISKAAPQITAAQKIAPLLGIFQKLISSKANDHEGFYLLQSLVKYVDPAAMNQFMKQVFVLLFKRLSGSKTTKFVKGLIVFSSYYAFVAGPTVLAGVVDEIQANMFGMVVEKIFIPDVQKVSGNTERKICAVGITKILCEYPEMVSGKYSHLWAPLLQGLIGLFELPEDETVPDDEHFIEIEDTPGYQASYAQLVFAKEKEEDPFRGQVADARHNLAISLRNLSTANPGKIPLIISSKIDPQATAFLQQYLHAAGVTMS